MRHPEGKMNKLAIIIVSLVLVTAVGLGSAGCAQTRRSISGALPYHEQRLTVSKGQDIGFAVELSAGDSLEGSVQEIAGYYNAFVFWITDPNGKTVYDVELEGKHDFTFRATIDGYYALHFYSFTSDKEAIVKYRRT